MGAGMNADRLFGGLDINKFHDEGVLEYLLDNSFMNHEYVVFEEMMDAPDFILEQLKDILSSENLEMEHKCILSKLDLLYVIQKN
jgi:hypothetical protein